MTLIDGNEKPFLKFACKACGVHVVGRMKKSVKLKVGTIRRLGAGG
jgi:putative protease